MYMTSDSHWDEHIATVMFSYNTSVHEDTDYSPFSLVFGRVPRLPSSTPPAEEYIDDTYHLTSSTYMIPYKNLRN